MRLPAMAVTSLLQLGRHRRVPLMRVWDFWGRDMVEIKQAAAAVSLPWSFQVPKVRDSVLLSRGSFLAVAMGLGKEVVATIDLR
jgi:hypothetical protein